MPVRRRLVLLALALAPFAAADRLISVPTARKLTDGTFRAESLRDLRDLGRGTDYFAAGLGPMWEGEFRYLRRGDEDDTATFDLTYNVIAAIPGFSPGFSFGVLDALDQSSDGIRFFGCTTIRNEFDHGNVPFDVTFGFLGGRSFSPYVGANVPVYSWLRLMAEHDGNRGRVAFEAQPLRGFRVRLISTEGHFGASIGYSAGF